MQPLAAFPRETLRAIRGVFTDIDDTLTTEGRLTADAYGAMERLQRAGLLVIPITGRPAGWCDHMARMWPCDGIVGENGAFYFRYEEDTRTLKKRYLLPAPERAENRRRLDALAGDILAAVPGAAVSADQAYREADLAIDYREDVEPLADEQVDRIVHVFEAAGAQAKISSIHVNGWYGDYDKLTMTRILMEECFNTDLEADKDRFVFAGDSPNDGPMFGFFPNSIGVANIRDFAGRLETPPAYVTPSPGGAGFAEIAEAILNAK